MICSLAEFESFPFFLYRKQWTVWPPCLCPPRWWSVYICFLTCPTCPRFLVPPRLSFLWRTAELFYRKSLSRSEKNSIFSTKISIKYTYWDQLWLFLLRSLWSCAATCLQQRSWPRRMIYSCSSVPSPPGVPPTTFPGGWAPEKCLPPSPDMVLALTSSSTSTVSCGDGLTSFTVVLCRCSAWMHNTDNVLLLAYYEP